MSITANETSPARPAAQRRAARTCAAVGATAPGAPAVRSAARAVSGAVTWIQGVARAETTVGGAHAAAWLVRYTARGTATVGAAPTAGAAGSTTTASAMGRVPRRSTKPDADSVRMRADRAIVNARRCDTARKAIAWN